MELAFVGEVDGKPIGMVFCQRDYNPQIKAISTKVVPEYQATGMGSC